MPKKEKMPKKHKVESKSLTKKINAAIQDPTKFQGMPQVLKNQILAAIKGTPDYQRLYASLNPADKQYVDLNIGSPKGREAGLFRSEKPHMEKISNLTPEQSRAAYAFLEQTIPEAFLPENATPQQIKQARDKGLGGTLAALEKQYQSPLNTQLNNMFGHMANPVMQAFLNPERGNEARGSMFPDRIEQEYRQGQMQQQQENNPLRQLMGALGDYGMKEHVMPWLQKPENLEQLYNYGQQGLSNAYQGAGNAYGGIQDLLGNLAGGVQNYADTGYSGIRNPQTYGQSLQQVLGTLMQPAVHPQQFVQGLGDMGRNAFNYMRGQ